MNREEFTVNKSKEQCREAGRIGGSKHHPETRYFHMYPEKAREIGRKGGLAKKKPHRKEYFSMDRTLYTRREIAEAIKYASRNAIDTMDFAELLKEKLG